MEKQITIKIKGIGARSFVDDKTEKDLTGVIFSELAESFESVIKKFIRLENVRFTEAVKIDMKKKKKLLPTNFKSFEEMGLRIEVE